MGIIGIKARIVLAIAFAALADRSQAGVIPVEAEAFDQQQDTAARFTGPLSSSYSQFHGPVSGPAYEVKVPYAPDHEDEANRLHGQHDYAAVDFVAHPKYEFAYGVEDRETGDFHAQTETRDGSNVSGQYTVKEPGGGVRVVSYRADEDGFHAVVHTSGKNEHSPGSYAGQEQPRVHDHRIVPQQEQRIGDYVNSYVTDQAF